MKNTYLIKKAILADLPLESDTWLTAKKGELEHFPWNDNPKDCPKTEFYILYDENGIGIKYISYETDLTMDATFMNDDVYKDSCVEFFFNLNPTSTKKYLNFELSATGFMHLGFGTCRYDRIIPEIDFSQFHIVTKVLENRWEAKFYIPFAFLKDYFEETENVFCGNLQKCVEAKKTPHFGCWNRITTEKPDFHAPNDFGEFKLETSL